MEWRPIETAPKSKDILLFCPRQGLVVGRWCRDACASKPRPYWTNDREAMFGIRETRADQPTHWMPFPPYPKINDLTPGDDNQNG